jgi:hypothetical protein
MIILSYLGSFDGINLLKSPWDQLLVAVVSVGTYYGGGQTGLTRRIIDEDEVEREEENAALARGSAST